MAPEEPARVAMPNRRSIRKRGWDYTAPGWYFITINTHRGRSLFGVIANGQVVLSAAGRAVAEEWFKSAIIRPGIELDEFVVMPNHVHGLVRLPEGRQEGRPAGRPCSSPCSPCGPPPGSLGAFVAGFKGAAGRAINAARVKCHADTLAGEGLLVLKPNRERSAFRAVLRVRVGDVPL